MRVRFRYFVPVAVSALLTCACGETKQQQTSASSAGTGGVLATGGAPAVAGSSAQAGHTSEAGARGSSAGTGQAQAGRAGGGAGGAPACVPEAHERPEATALTGSFASLIGNFVGLYKIDDVYEQGSDCTSMCRTGSSVFPLFRPLPYLSVALGQTGRYDVLACQSPEACTSADGVRARLGAVDSAKSDQFCLPSVAM
jgi:hypothetical protein